MVPIFGLEVHPEYLYDAPANEFVAKFLGSGNVFTGEIIGLVIEYSAGDGSNDRPVKVVLSG